MEYYDSKQDPTMMYFMEKIQLLLSNEKALEAIKRVTHALGASLLGGHISDSKKPPAKPIKNSTKSLSPDQARYLEKKKEEFQFRLNTIKEATQNTQTPPKIDNLLKEHEEKIKQLSAKKKAEISCQEDELSKRIKERQHRSFQKSFSAYNRNGAFGNRDSISLNKDTSKFNDANILEKLDSNENS